MARLECRDTNRDGRGDENGRRLDKSLGGRARALEMNWLYKNSGKYTRGVMFRGAQELNYQCYTHAWEWSDDLYTMTDMSGRSAVTPQHLSTGCSLHPQKLTEWESKTSDIVPRRYPDLAPEYSQRTERSTSGSN